MYLKTLELQGFKSFPDKTVIEFDKGMTAIVGANGSGKSNISDAVRWVLGEMSAKSLRGSKMEDVIFNGSAKRKPASFAEVVMTIDNSDFLMKIDYDEVSVGRRLYRSGESEYFLNKKQVRLKDVVELFLNTGIGREGYSVISQGKIAEIISLKGNERRELFEEAAGISRFRYRKHEASLKLQSVTDNSLRIGDILSEVQGRLPRLEAQSAKAKEYLAVCDEKRNLEMGIWAKRLKKIEEFSLKGGAEYEAEEKAIAELNRIIEEKDRVLDEIYIETQEKNLKSELLRGEVSALAAEDASLSAKLSVLENELHHMELKRAEIASMGEEGGAKEKALAEEKAQLEIRFSEVQSELDQIEKSFEENQSRQREATAAFAALAEEEEAILTQKEDLARQKASLSLKTKEEEGFALAARQQIEELQNRLSQGGVQDAEAAKRLAQLRENAQALQGELAKAERLDGKINLALYHLGEEFEENAALIQKKRLEKMDLEQRRDTLLRMERLLEGFSESVKEVMNAAGEELSGICGPVSKLISTDEDYVLAIETALGGGVQNVVVENEQCAKEAIAFLKKGRYGRATFLPLTTLRVAKYNTAQIREKDFLGLASDFCRCEEKYRPAIEFLLGKTLICRDIDSASRLARAEKYGVKIVTLDGQVIHAGGSFTGGQALNLTGVLSRTGDLARLKDQIEEKSGRLEELRGETDSLEEKRSLLRAEAKEQEEYLNGLRRKAGEARNSLTLEEERALAAQNAYRRIEEEMRELEEKDRVRKENLASLQERIALLDSEEKNILPRLEQLQAEMEAKEKEREERIIEQGSILALRGTAQLRLEQEAVRLNENENAFRLLREKESNREALLEKLREDRENALLQIRTHQEERERISDDIHGKKEEISALQSRVNAAGEESAAIRQEQKELQGQKEKRMENFSRLSARLGSAAKEKEGILRSLREEYELSADSEEFRLLENTDVEALGGEARLQTLRGQLRRIGPVNLDSVQELEEAKERFEFLNGQYSDIIKSKEELEKLISDLESTMRDMFSETFEKIRYTFRRIFTELFGGGTADIELTNKEDLLNCGVEIKVQPPGKLIKSLSLLSGGEQAFVAIALYMSLLHINPSPFCIFDEIESALDEANVRRFARYIKNHNDRTQFIVITHRRGTMEEADTLYGITMQEKGISDFIRLDAEESAKFSTDEK